MKKLLIILLLVVLALPLFAQDNEIVLQTSTMPEAKLGYTRRFVFPVMQGENPLTENNNVTLSLTAEATPISINGIFKTVLTPIAFIELAVGGRIGAGWPVNLLGSDIYGTGLNLSDADGKAVYEGSAFDALLWKAFIGGTFQFDLAALYPGDWNHVVALSYHELNFHGNTRAKAGQAWYFESGDGENCNGLNYYGNYLIGYQMPIFLDMVALLAEGELYLYDTPGRSVWGDDLMRWTYSGILSFAVTEQFGIAVLAQLRTRRNYTEATKDLHYQSRVLNASNPRCLEFYRVAAAFSYKF